ncbi:8-hydroxygeraniol dehydrogenase-like [Olea europaea subsp. europaea]|uniref:8-hydroxygeraniol dehydrogenase-like n=1 Tax=Olea europaea subsp. europaea TaxID=158383 RepID=A0A8S0QTU6_OLEEU|nr:8-hydroxygeraniol dehydrogenase-like [Olea europaea subsp. europaea]
MITMSQEFDQSKLYTNHYPLEHPVKAFGWAVRDPSAHFSPFNFSRRATGGRDVQVKVLYCGICHSDLHMAKNEWGLTQFPIVPGHEITGMIIEFGSKVEKFKVGDKVGVGGMVGSISRYTDGTVTYGGYSDKIVADEHFAIRWPENLPLDAGAPLLCAGITSYSPLKYYGLDKPGLNIGVVGLGGLGHVAVKFAKAFGSKVTVISTSINKKQEATERLGADSFLVSHDQEAMEAAAGTLDGIIDTVSVAHPLLPLVNLLKPHSHLIMVGAAEKPLEVPMLPLIFGRKSISGSGIGGIKETPEMVDFAAKNNVSADIEIISMDYINTAMKRLKKSDVKYRFVIDVANSLKVE